MPDYQAPGVYVEETGFREKTIAGVSTSTAAMVGPSPRGPSAPTLVTSWDAYQRTFGAGEDHSGTFLPHAVRGFFENGGRRLYVARIGRSDATPAQARVATRLAGQALRVRAVSDGSLGNRLRVTLHPGADSRMDVRIGVEGGSSSVYPDEHFSGLSIVPGEQDYFIERINADSGYVELTWADPALPAAAPRAVSAEPLSGGADGVEPYRDAHFVGGFDPGSRTATGLTGLADVADISLITIPDAVNAELVAGAADRRALAEAQVRQCERLRHRFAILNVPSGSDDARTIRPAVDSSRAAVYFPWLYVRSFDGTSTELVPPSGHVAGIYARVDRERGVHKAPANVVVRGLAPSALQFDIDSRAQRLFNASQVNPIRRFPRRGTCVWGVRTLSSDPEWKYVNVRRTLIFLERSIREGTEWVAFERNGEPLWQRVRRSIESFLHRQWTSGSLRGTKPDEAFFVRCDRSTMTRNDIDTGRLICEIGVAPVKPAEFVVIRIRRQTSGAARP